MRRWQRIQQPWRRWDESRLRRNLSVYIHVPFCLRRCGYCDFLSFSPQQRPAGLTPQSYAETLHAEIAARAALAQRLYAPAGRRVDSVFFGGGTPTCLAPDALCGVIRGVLAQFPLADGGVEVTVEANPDTLTPQYLEALHAAGVNRLSIGVQATQPHCLAFLGRTHRWRGIEPVLQAVARGPIRRFSFDLIYAVPRLTDAELRESVERLLTLGAEHLSAYELTVEPDTKLGAWARQFPRQAATVETAVRQQHVVERTLAGYGLYRYEVSNYARPGAECRHNLRYWRGGDYIGLGLGAASRIGREVVNNSRDFAGYQLAVSGAGSGEGPLASAYALAYSSGQDTAPPADAFLKLRTRAGIPASLAGAAGAQWLQRLWVKPQRGMVAITSGGLNFAELLARQTNAD